MNHIDSYPVDLAEANAFVKGLHRHHQPVHRDKFRIGARLGDKLVGVAQCGRPVSRVLDDGYTLEVVRLCTDGTKNACSFLYSACARVAKDLGYSKIITYILESEEGKSLEAAGWLLDGFTQGHSWDTPSRRRTDKAPTCSKKRYVKVLRKETIKVERVAPEESPVIEEILLFERE